KLFDNYLSLYVPGNAVTRFPAGTAKRIPADWNLVLQVHYVPTGKEQVDQIAVCIEYAQQPQVQVATRMVSKEIILQPFEVQTITKEVVVEDDYLLIALYPHMHLRGRSMTFEAFFPDGGYRRLLNVPEYDFEWQHRYVLAEPCILPKGTRLLCTGVFDNS